MKIKLPHFSFLVLILGALWLSSSFKEVKAQQSLVFQERNPDFRNAMDLYQKEKYLPAQEHFEKTIEQIHDVHSEVRIDAEYYRALCAIHLFHDNASALLKKFIEDHPESPHIVSAYFQLANFKFRKRDYDDVIEYLSKVNPLDLNDKDQAEYHFKIGYSYFQLEEFDNAAKHFYEIKDTDNLYVSAARYYYAHIAYKAGKYETAAQNFRKIEQDPQFGPLVPYYLTQIYYLQKKYEELLSYAPPVLDSAPPKREDEIRKLIGDAYYETGQYKKAIPYLEKYLQRNQGTVDDYYEIGLSYFNSSLYTQSITSLQKAIGENDSLSQSAYYYIGESNIKNDNKRAARSAFRNAYQLGVDEEITEDALFNYAKVAYELSYHPYDDAILAFEEYINKYPGSNKIKSAYEYLVGVYYTTKNYEEALKSIDRIKSNDIKLLQAKQRLAYYRGVELFNQRDFIAAVEMFQLSLDNNYEPKLKASAQFWMAEGFYRLGDYDNAANYFSDFLASSGSRSLPFYKKGYYHLGYVYYEKRAYKSAIFWLREYTEKADSKNKGLINDAYLRIGDSYFIQKDYDNAVEFYDKAIEVGVKDKDYALLQSAIASGVMGEYKTKVQKLKKLINDSKASVYKDDALFELGKTHLLMNKQEDALAYYNQLVADYPNSSYMAEAYLKVGLIHFNHKEDDLALNSFDQVVKSYPNTKSAKEALDKIRKIFIDKGDAQAFEDYINGVPFADISKSKLDSTAYVIAENHYLEGDCERATRDFTNYLKRYPNGLFKLNARFYRGSCEAAAGFEQEAARDLQYVVDQPINKFTEKSLVELGRIYKSMSLLDSAAGIYERLLSTAERKSNLNLAQKALMDIYFQKENYKEAAKYAEILLEDEMLSSELWQQAQLIMAKTFFEKENYTTSKLYLDTLVKMSTEIGAEAKYLLAKTYYLEGKYNESDTIVYSLVDQVPSFPYWIAKGFILLADNFIAKEDYYNARVTFQSVIDNSDNEELVSIAREKLEILNQAKADKEKEEEPFEVEIDVDKVRDKSIFETDSMEIKKEVPDEK